MIMIIMMLPIPLEDRGLSNELLPCFEALFDVSISVAFGLASGVAQRHGLAVIIATLLLILETTEPMLEKKGLAIVPLGFVAQRVGSLAQQADPTGRRRPRLWWREARRGRRQKP
jgi:hypothetical protein